MLGLPVDDPPQRRLRARGIGEAAARLPVAVDEERLLRQVIGRVQPVHEERLRARAASLDGFPHRHLTGRSGKPGGAGKLLELGFNEYLTHDSNRVITKPSRVAPTPTKATAERETPDQAATISIKMSPS